MGQVELASSRCPEAFSGVIVVPYVQITNLRTFWSRQTDDGFGRYTHGNAQARSTEMGLYLGFFGGGYFVVEVLISVDFGSWLGKVGGFWFGQTVCCAFSSLGADGVVSHFRECLGGFLEKEWEQRNLIVEVRNRGRKLNVV